MVGGQLLALFPRGGEGLLAQRLLRRRHRGIDIGPTVRRHWRTHLPPPSQRRCGQESGLLGVPLGHHYPGHLFESRRHQVVRTGRPTLPQSLLQQWEGGGGRPRSASTCPENSKASKTPTRTPCVPNSSSASARSSVRPVEVAPRGRSQGEAVEGVTGPPGVPDLPAHVQAFRAISLEHRKIALVPGHSSQAKQGIGHPTPVTQGAPALQDFRVGGLSPVELAAFLHHQRETERGRRNAARSSDPWASSTPFSARRSASS